MDDNQLLRYSRQIMLPQIDLDGQNALLQSRVLIMGLGGLGSPAAIYLAAAGIGHLTLVDFDKVDLSNLQRQVLHGTGDIGRAKTDSAVDTLSNINPETRLATVDHKPDEQELLALCGDADVVVDATDNFSTRFAINRACVNTGTPLVTGAAIRMEAQVSVFLNDGEGPCYRCLYRDEDAVAEDTCSETGILAPVTGIIGAMQALETIKILTRTGRTLNGRVLVFDAALCQWREISLKRDPFCPVCAT